MQLQTITAAEGDEVLEGILVCPGCMRESPIIDGIPIIVSDIRSYIQSATIQLHWRDDLSETMASLIGDCCGPGSSYDLTRYYLSSYGWGHYHDLDPEDTTEGRPALLGALDQALEAAGPLPSGLVLDLGCSVGRSSFYLAEQTGSPVLGLDLNFAMLRLARRAARGEVSYPLRRGGLVYSHRRFPAALPAADRVEFWAADASCLPLGAGRFSAVSSLNLLDCVANPYEHLSEIARVLAPDGRAWIGCPYDWSSAATDPPYWLGGHSQRSALGGDSAAMMRAMLTPGATASSLSSLSILAEREGVPWVVRLHDRSKMLYDLHLVVAGSANTAD